MDAALIQCLAHIPELNQYFRSGLYRHELNPDNPLGTEGLFATTFSALLHYLHLSGGTPNPSVAKSVNGGRENSSVSYAPRGFKQALTRLAPAFLSRLQQHDARELLDFLLNELHGDLNRVLEEPDIETPEWPETCGGRDAETRLAKETWKVYRQRNDSIIVDLFQGMYKSTLVCPECARVSITFNPFMHLTLPLPLPIPETWRHTVYYVPWDLNKATLAVQIEVPKDSNYRYLKKLFGRWFNVNPENLLAAEVWSHKFYKFYDDHMNLTQLAEKDVLVIYELPIPFKSGAKLPPPNGDSSKTFSPPSLSTFSQFTLDSAPFILPVFYTTNQRGISSVFGVPFILVLTAAEACSREAIYRAVVERCGRWTRLRADLWCRPVGIEDVRPNEPVENMENSDGSTMAILTTQDGLDAYQIIRPQEDLFELKIYNSGVATSIETGFDMNPTTARFVDWSSREPRAPDVTSITPPTQPLVKATDALVCQWPSTMSGHFFPAENSLFNQWEAYVHPEVEALRAAESKLRSGRQTVDIEDCLSEFTREQQLNENNLWHCPGCRKHQQATKKVELWSIPDILVVHLKRPSNTGEMQDKVDALVDFPVEGLDLGQRVGMRGAEGDGGEEGKYVYDLFALGEHTGGSTSEDYRAYAKNFSDGEWYCFNDDSINKLSTEGFVNAIAHFLFYRRRAAIPGAVIDKVRSRNENSSANNSKSKPMAEIIAEPQNIPQPPNRIDVKPRDELSSLATNGYACLVTHSRTLLDCVHVMARATDAKILRRLECAWGMKPLSLNIDTSRNLMWLDSSLRKSYNNQHWTLLPSSHLLEEIQAFTVENLIYTNRPNFTKKFPHGIREYTFVQLEPRKEPYIRYDETLAAGYSDHRAPFTSLSPIRSHVHPFFVVCDVARKDKKLRPKLTSRLAHGYDTLAHDPDLLARIRQCRTIFALWDWPEPESLEHGPGPMNSEDSASQGYEPTVSIPTDSSSIPDSSG